MKPTSRFSLEATSEVIKLSECKLMDINKEDEFDSVL